MRSRFLDVITKECHTTKNCKKTESVRSRFLGVITKEYETTKSRKKQNVCVMVLWDYHKGDPDDKEPQRGSNDI